MLAKVIELGTYTFKELALSPTPPPPAGFGATNAATVTLTLSAKAPTGPAGAATSASAPSRRTAPGRGLGPPPSLTRSSSVEQAREVATTYFHRMQKWEYLRAIPAASLSTNPNTTWPVRWIIDGNTELSFDKEPEVQVVNALGQEGWELVAGIHGFWFKRPVLT